MNTSGFGGGFGGGGDDAFNSTNQFGTPGGKPKQKRISTIVPATVKQIKDNEDEALVIDGNEVCMIVIVGLIQDVQIASTKVSYTINDGTGYIEAQKWIEDGKADSGLHRPLMENTYCRIIGTIKLQQGQHYILAFNIKEITDINMITKHMLETVYFKLNLESIERLSSAITNPAIEGGFDKAVPAVTKAAGGIHGFSATQNMVYSFIQISAGDAGCNRETLYSGLKGKVNTRVVDETLDFLSGEGHTYTTVDDDHFKTTDV